MGPLIYMKNLGSAPSFIVRSLCKLIQLVSFFYSYFIFRNKPGRKMSANPTPTLQEDQVAKLAEEAAAAVRAAMADRSNRRPGADPASGAPAKPPASGGSVQTVPTFPPASERSKIIRVNRQLNSSADILGDAGGETSLSLLENFHSLQDGRTHRSVLVENMADFAISHSL
jgi:hypothetical protein